MQKRSSFKDTKNAKIQLTWKNVTISSSPKKRICKGRDENYDAGRVILDDLSGTVKPGQF